MRNSSNYFKWPSTPYIKGFNNDYKNNLIDLNKFNGKSIVITEKRDGENNIAYLDGKIQARSVGSNNKLEYRTLFKTYWNNILYTKIINNQESINNICSDMGLLGFVFENLYARHSIEYVLPKSNMFELIAIRDENKILNWEDTIKISTLLNIPTVPVLNTQNKFSSIPIDILSMLNSNCENIEGVVIRLTNDINITEFSNSIGKIIRTGYRQSSALNWKSTWSPNTFFDN